MGLFKKIGRAFKKAAKAIKKGVNTAFNAIKNMPKNLMSGLQNLKNAIVQFGQQAFKFALGAIKFATLPLRMGVALLTHGPDAARDLFVTGVSEFAMEFNKLAASTANLAFAAIKATPLGAIANDIPALRMALDIAQVIVTDTLSQVGYLAMTAAAFVGAIGEESFKNVMKKGAELALGIMEMAGKMNPVGRAVDAALTVHHFATGAGKEQVKAVVNELKSNPGSAANLAVGFAVGAGMEAGMGRMGGSRSSTGGGSQGTGMPSGDKSTLPSGGAQPRSTGQTADGSKPKPADDGGTSNAEIVEVGAEGAFVGVELGAYQNASGSSAEQYPQFSSFEIGSMAGLMGMMSMSFGLPSMSDDDEDGHENREQGGRTNQKPAPVAAAAA